MSHNDLAVRFERTDVRLTVFFSGELDCASVEELGDLKARVARTDRDVVLDLSGLRFCASAGLTLFIQLHNLVRDQGHALVLHGPTDGVRRAIQLCRLDEVLAVTGLEAAVP